MSCPGRGGPQPSEASIPTKSQVASDLRGRICTDSSPQTGSPKDPWAKVSDLKGLWRGWERG